jgi:hypothetical protein
LRFLAYSHDPQVKREIFQSAHAAKRPFLQHAQQFGLQAQLQLANFIQKECAAFSLLEQSFFTLFGVGARNCDNSRICSNGFPVSTKKGLAALAGSDFAKQFDLR